MEPLVRLLRPLAIQTGSPPESPFDRKMVIAILCLMTTIFICSGFLLATNPARFVRVYRRVAIGDYHAKSAEWERKLVCFEGRLLGAVFFCFGLGGLYLLLKFLRVIL
jgi:hypothetical protein